MSWVFNYCMFSLMMFQSHSTSTLFHTEFRNYLLSDAWRTNQVMLIPHINGSMLWHKLLDGCISMWILSRSFFVYVFSVHGVTCKKCIMTVLYVTPLIAFYQIFSLCSSILYCLFKFNIYMYILHFHIHFSGTCVIYVLVYFFISTCFS